MNKWKVFLAGDLSEDFCHQQLGCQLGKIYTELWPTELQGVRSACPSLPGSCWKLTQVRGAATVSWNIFISWNDSTAKVGGISFRMNKVVLHLQGKELPAFRIWEELVLSWGTWSLASTKVLNGLVVSLTSIIFWCLKKKSVKICTTQWAYIFQRPRAYISKLHIVHDLFEEIKKKVFVSRNASVCKDAVQCTALGSMSAS